MKRGNLLYTIYALAFFVLLLGFPMVSVAQVPIYDPATGLPVTQTGEQIDYRTEEEKAADLAEEEARNPTDSTAAKPRKPLLSPHFDDTTRFHQRLFTWNVNTRYSSVQKSTIDTMLQGDFQIDYPFMAIDGGIGSAFLGNIGSATIPLNYFSRQNPANFSFTQVWDTYMKTPDQVNFYNTRRPYSRLDFSMSGNVAEEERMLKFILSHNINPSTNLNMEYTGEGTGGQYINQKTLVWDLNISMAHTGKRWTVHGGYIYSGGNISENGGIIDDKLITDTLISQPNQIEVRLQDADNRYRSHTGWLTASYAIPLRAMRGDEITLRTVPTLFVGSSLNYTLRQKTYTAQGDTTLYPISFIDPNKTYDSIAQQMLDTRVFMQLQPYNRDGVVGLISAGVGVDWSAYYLNVPGDMRESWNVGGRMERTTLYGYADIDGKISRYANWDAGAKVNLLGFRVGDLEAKGRVMLAAWTKRKQRPISLEADIHFALQSPTLWENHYYSNHFRWNNDFDRQTSTTISGRFKFDQIGFELGANYQIATNKIYYDADMQVAQFGGALNVIGAYLRKDFKFGGMHLNHTLMAQYSSHQDVAPVPLFSAYLNYYYAFNIVRGVLNMEMGINGRYQTKYYGFGYNPALGQFYNQQEAEVGGFPYLDAYAAAKWKRMRILLKLHNWNVNLFGGRNYFQVAHYPQNRMMFKIKVSWSFYD